MSVIAEQCSNTVAEIKSYGAGSKETGAKTSAHGGGTKWQVSIFVLTFNKGEDNATTVSPRTKVWL